MRKYYIPETLITDLAPLLENNGYENLAKRHLIKCFYIIDKLYMERIVNKTCNIHSYINLHSEILCELLGSDYYPEIMKALIMLKIIEPNHSYQVGSKSKSYRLTIDYIKSKFKVVEDNSKFTQKDERKKAIRLSKDTKDIQYHQLLLNLKDTRLDYAKTNLFLKKVVAEINRYLGCNGIQFLGLEETETKKNIDRLFDLYNVILEFMNESKEREEYLEKYIYCVFQIVRLLEMEYDPEHIQGLHFIIDNKGYRCHNNIATLKSELRQCIYQRNNKDAILANCDIKCSQILTLIMYLKYTFKTSYYTFPDFIEFENAYNNDFYAVAMRIMNWEGSRKEFKAEFFSTIYFGRTYSNPMSDWFSSAFPNVYRVIKDLKSTHYSNFAIQMQRTESSFIYQTLRKIITFENENGIKPYRDLYYLTIHDSIVVEEKYSPMIVEVLSNELKKYQMYNCIKVELLNQYKKATVVPSDYSDKLKILNENLSSLTTL